MFILPGSSQPGQFLGGEGTREAKIRKSPTTWGGTQQWLEFILERKWGDYQSMLRSENVISIASMFKALSLHVIFLPSVEFGKSC